MKYEVVRKFTDKHTGEKYPVGSILELEPERVKEINSKEKEIKDKLIKKVKEPESK